MFHHIPDSLNRCVDLRGLQNWAHVLKVWPSQCKVELLRLQGCEHSTSKEPHIQETKDLVSLAADRLIMRRKGEVAINE